MASFSPFFHPVGIHVNGNSTHQHIKPPPSSVVSSANSASVYAFPGPRLFMETTNTVSVSTAINWCIIASSSARNIFQFLYQSSNIQTIPSL